MMEASGERAWKQLRILNYYQLALAGLFAGLSLDGSLPTPLGSFDAALFSRVASAYFGASLLALIAIRLHRPGFDIQVPLHIAIDVIAITLLMHASGGVRSGLGMLLIVSVAGSSLLMEGRTARLFAALAALAVLLQQAGAWLLGGPPADYTHAGLLGASFFATAVLGYSLARRLRESEALAERRGLDLAELARLTQYVIQRMQTGILVVDERSAIRLGNESALRLLDIPEPATGLPLAALCPPLEENLREWWSGAREQPSAFRTEAGAAEVMPRFARLGEDLHAGTLIFLEDMAAITQQAQQLKLASLGRLTAGIAHEIRNPLGAISHAAQLLAESPQLGAGDLRLTEIIRHQSKRVNAIVENIMQLSRGQQAEPEALALHPWLERFAAEFISSERLEPGRMRVEIDPADLHVQVDPGQLHQILSNLCHNGLRHGGENLRLRTGREADGRAWLEVIDDGPGIDKASAQQIFEPFFTTSSAGTGLGLYIARELCLANQARISHMPDRGGACFRITFADPRRRQAA
ncbi:MAG: ATP-binding protein [Gammaproteobacteria bacterium]|jgi:two-component system sensor histidine kinase PilS (NtrC family)|nr:ATP-binding protein [Gammaproteobacteria bacterium]